MDVVDTLRHDQRLVERELSADASDEALIKRLREVYKGQGIEVPDRVLEEGVKALKEKRFSYEPPRPSLARSLALLWIGRERTGKILLGAFLALLAAWLAYDFFVGRPQRLAQRQAAAEIAEIFPRTLAAGYADVLRETKVDAATQHAARLMADGKAALARGDAAGARKAAADMEVLLGDLRAEFMLRIVNRPGEASGVWREPMINTRARNDYLIVEAIAPDGKVLSRPILNEETGVTSTVDKWGVRVSNDVFEKVLLDKRDNGIIERNIVGQKKRGSLDVEYAMPVLGGTITKW
jgi:cell division protein FtsB